MCRCRWHAYVLPPILALSILNTSLVGAIKVHKHAVVSDFEKDLVGSKIGHSPLIIGVSRIGLHLGQSWDAWVLKSFCFKYHQSDHSTSLWAAKI
jgi:hypothetical protein